LDTLTGPSVPGPAVSHSYTSIEAYEKCPRKHYLDYVVNAFSDYRETSERTDDVSQREVGLLFHDTAEIASQESNKEKQKWYEICERLAGQKHAEDTVEAAKECIDRYFELDISNWEVLDAEREFELNLDGHELIGSIDAVYRTPQDDLVVVDYKATDRRRDIQNDKQLPIYLLACRDLYDEPVSHAGYAYVGSIGPETETRGFDEGELDRVLSEVKDSMEEISDASFENYISGDHCRWCQHSRLPCAPDDI
jgi:DNA helicase-2/ATP-dependent DNA helicase PcrA